MSQEELIELITKEFSGTISPDEGGLLKDQINKDQKSNEIYESLRANWHAAGNMKLKHEIDVEKSWTDFEARKNDAEAKNIELMPWLSGIAAAIVLALGLVFYTYMVDEEMTTYQVNAGQVQEALLPDGSKVTINGPGTLTLAIGFNEVNRRMKLSGDAFFEVARNENVPFIIETGGVITQVLGTSFQLTEINGEVAIEVVTGKVSFSNEHAQLILTANMAASFTADKGIRYTAHPAIQEQGILNFDNLDLGTIVVLLMERFDATITFDNSRVKECLFTSRFEDPNLENVLQVIAITLDLEIEKLNNLYIIKGNGCL